MNSKHDEDRFLTMGEVARLWRVSPDSLRSWADRGVLNPVLTPGGQRRFRQREVAAVLGNPAAAEQRGQSDGRRRGEARSPKGPEHVVRFPSHHQLRMNPVTGPEVDEAREELEVTRARRETEALLREMEQEARETARHAEADRLQRENERRLEDLKAYGRSLAVGLPIEWRQQVISLLERFVNARNIPPSLPDQEAHALIAARVQRIQERYDAQEAREIRDVIERAQVERLIQTGRNTAKLLTFSWESQDGEEAQAEVARELSRCVGPDWSEADVRRRVEGILKDWGEEDDEADEDDNEADW